MKKIILLLVVLILIAACENKTTLQQNTQATQQTQEKVQSTQQTTQPSGEKTLAKGLKDIFAGPKAKYTADYKITSEGKTMNTRYIMDLPKFAMETATDDGVSKSIFDGTTFFICSNSNSKWQCFKMPVQTPDAVNTEKDVADGTIVPVYLGTCSIAAESGLKYSVTAKGETSTLCYTNDGILLEMATPKMSMTATKVSRTVAADAFVPPAEPMSIPAIPQ